MKDAVITPIANLTSSISYFRYVATELATDMVISVGDVKFYVHKVYSFQPEKVFLKFVFFLKIWQCKDSTSFDETIHIHFA